MEHNHRSRSHIQLFAAMAAYACVQPLGRVSHVDVERPSTHHSGNCSVPFTLLVTIHTIQQHRGDMAGSESSVVEILMQISGQYAAEYLLYPRLREQVKEAFATGNFT